MADLEDAEASISEQERWGLGRVGQAVKRLAAAVRLIRARVVQHDQRLDEIETRLNELDPPG
jgi:hypothetical protein